VAAAKLLEMHLFALSGAEDTDLAEETVLEDT
jgi:hypothetical protein